ncbi:NRAMP-like transporter smf-3 [Recurvomyces mirabilis]|uniref:NRAMP-like transporter smf-3 n=1 Tax=Recurvomyces mirabilis TaxID=574656 RepID=A0AAE0WQA3_9PEZI|nr:NRAMP-like transporter smf-3 [Recurvomyces mirabilis]KAK5153763.1 NRAMP-like transporter smf-3 [Recurvomyces mirabilis]
MNCPSKTDPIVPDGYNQSPNALAGDTTTRSDLSTIANARLQRDHRIRDEDPPDIELVAPRDDTREGGKHPTIAIKDGGHGGAGHTHDDMGTEMLPDTPQPDPSNSEPNDLTDLPWYSRQPRKLARILLRYTKFIGPGFLISVAYIDPGNYATDVAAGATYQYKLLFMILLSNLFAIFLQSLCIKLGTVTGMNLAEMCRAHMPRWLNYVLYVFAEVAIIATDIAEVIGTAVALNLLSNGKIPLVAGCAISIVDVMFILLFYRPNGESMKALRGFEFFVMALVLGVVVCFCFQLSVLTDTNVGHVFKGYLPSRALVEGQGLYQACGILGATVMPHSLYLGSGIIQARLQDFDRQLAKTDPSHLALSSTISPPSHHPALAIRHRRRDIDNNNTTTIYDDETEDDKPAYRPSLKAINSCLTYSTTELTLSLLTFALFVNSAILIVAGSALYDPQNPTGNATAANASLFGIYHLLSTTLSKAAGTIFALALLLSGVSAGIVCTIAGQMVSEGQLRLRVKPWVRRLMTRAISITPSIIIAGAVGAEGLSRTLQASQVVLSVILPFVSAPLIWFTCRAKYMGVSRGGGIGDGGVGEVNMRNGWFTAGLAVVVWGVIVVMNVALIVLLGMGVG